MGFQALSWQLPTNYSDLMLILRPAAIHRGITTVSMWIAI